MELTQVYVKSLFDYRDGVLYWKIQIIKKEPIGSRAGFLYASKKHKAIGQPERYRVRIKGKYYAVSRIIFLWHKGWLPEIVDHENRNCQDDRIDNLRAATHQQNCKNRTSAKGSSSKYLGVNWKEKIKKWQSRIRHDRKDIYIGVYTTQEAAALAYNTKAVFYHGEFANLNIIQPS